MSWTAGSGVATRGITRTFSIFHLAPYIQKMAQGMFRHVMGCPTQPISSSLRQGLVNAETLVKSDSKVGVPFSIRLLPLLAAN